MKTYEKIKKYTYGTILSVGSVKTPGFKPKDNYFIDKTTYLFGNIIKTKRIWNLSEIKKYKCKEVNKIGYIK